MISNGSDGELSQADPQTILMSDIDLPQGEDRSFLLSSAGSP